MSNDNHFTLQKSKVTRSEVVVLPRNHPSFQTVEKTFEDGWMHLNKRKPPIRAIFEIRLPQEMLDAFDQYKMRVASSLAPQKHSNRPVEKILFHGTNRSCLLGENKDRTRPCGLSECPLCAIVGSSFDISKCGRKTKFCRFGMGIYSTSCSSKADDYVMNGATKAIYRVMLASRVIVGKPYRRLKNGTHLTGPPPGYHSIVGEPGVDLNFPETVVYNDDAIRPAFLVVYGFPPERPAAQVWYSALKLFKMPLAS
ncbi:hypothetical protein E4T56_gene7193 [Termitomyces sp. T112]|nr:hypothetical protein E4T56_gene7193 [Termitomyces sp. T112]